MGWHQAQWFQPLRKPGGGVVSHLREQERQLR